MKTDYNRMVEEDEYIAQLSDQERIVFEIAQSHLGSSFDIFKSIGFLIWKKNKSITNEP
jgi:hypothetical protein